MVTLVEQRERERHICKPPMPTDSESKREVTNAWAEDDEK